MIITLFALKVPPVKGLLLVQAAVLAPVDGLGVGHQAPVAHGATAGKESLALDGPRQDLVAPFGLR